MFCLKTVKELPETTCKKNVFNCVTKVINCFCTQQCKVWHQRNLHGHGKISQWTFKLVQKTKSAKWFFFSSLLIQRTQSQSLMTLGWHFKPFEGCPQWPLSSFLWTDQQLGGSWNRIMLLAGDVATHGEVPTLVHISVSNRASCFPLGNWQQETSESLSFCLQGHATHFPPFSSSLQCCLSWTALGFPTLLLWSAHRAVMDEQLSESVCSIPFRHCSSHPRNGLLLWIGGHMTVDVPLHRCICQPHFFIV